MTKKILVLCTGNSCRSQIAEGYLRHFANGNAEVYSAGVKTHGVNPKAIAIMQEDGIDISKNDFYEILASDESISPKTALPSPEQFLPYFRDAQEKGDDLICILISSAFFFPPAAPVSEAGMRNSA